MYATQHTGIEFCSLLTGLYSCSYQYPSEPRKSASMRLSAERDNGKEVEQYPSKSKGLLKALLSRRKSKKDDTLYTYLDEYWYHRIYRKNRKCGVKSWKQINFCFLDLPILFNRLHFIISSKLYNVLFIFQYFTIVRSQIILCRNNFKHGSCSYIIKVNFTSFFFLFWYIWKQG